MRLLPYGDEGVLVELDDRDATLGLAAAIRAAGLPDVVDVVPAERTVLVTTSGNLAELRRALSGLRPVAAPHVRPHGPAAVGPPAATRPRSCDRV